MSILPRRSLSLAVTAAVAVAGAAVAGVVLFSSSQADEVDLTTASLVPADAGLYVAFNTDLDSTQWVKAFDLIERLGQEDPRGELRRTAEEDGELDWDEDVAPLLGGNAAFFLRSFDLNTFDISAGVIIRAKNPDQAIALLEEQMGSDFYTDEYGGVEIFVDEFDVTFAAVIGEHVVVTMDEKTLEDVIDVHNGDADSLATVSDFSALRDELSRNFLAFWYVDADSLVADAFGSDVFGTAMREAGVDMATAPMASVIGASGDGFNFQGASLAEAGVISPMLEPRTPSFAASLPDDTAVFVSVTGLGKAMSDAMDAARDELDDAAREGGYDSLDDALRDAADELGVESIEELFDLFAGESALAVWFPTGDEDQAEGAVLTTVSDPEAALDTLDGIVPPGSSRDTRTVDGVEVTIVTGDNDEAMAYAVDGVTLILGTEKGVVRILEYSGPVLADNATYQGAVADLPTALGSFGYFDLASLLRLAEGGVPAELDRADEVLRGMIVNVVRERGVVRVSGVVTIAEE